MPPCAECTRLFEEYERLDRIYASAHMAMIHASVGPAANYNETKAMASNAHLDSEAARLELDQHRRSHLSEMSTSTDKQIRPSRRRSGS